MTERDEVENMHVPKEGMVFKTDVEAHKFYNYYAMISGFSTAVAHNYHSRNKKYKGMITRKTITCN